MRKLLTVLIVAVLFGSCFDTVARRRSSSAVRQEQRRTGEQIRQTSKQIEANDREVGRQLDRLQSLEARIALRADTIAALRTRINGVTEAIDRLNDSITRLDAATQRLRESYASTLRNMRTRRQSMSDIAFIFSAETFTQAWRRLGYLQAVARASRKQGEQLKALRATLDAARLRHTALADSLSQSMAALQRSQSALTAERNSANLMVTSLRREGKALERELERRRRQAAALERELQEAIDREAAEAAAAAAAAEAARKEAERRAAEAAAAAAAETKTPAEVPATAAKEAPVTPPPAPPVPVLGENFADNKGKLPFPVAGTYTIISHFGTNVHPDLPKVQVENLGIDIEAQSGAAVRAVFDGVVSSIFRLDGYHNVVIVRHGEYLTVYAGLDNLSIKKGDTVKTGQSIGKVFTDTDDGDRTVLHFEIRREKQKLNPAEWVR